jgi:hypothetical protein
MNNIQDDDKMNTLRSLLRSLPKLRASENFEARLRQRIAHSDELQGDSDRHRIPLRAIPSFAYSSIAICMMFVLTYYLITENGIGPVVQPPVAMDHQTQMQPLNRKTQSSQDNRTTGAGEEKIYAHGKSTAIKNATVEVPTTEKNTWARDVEAGQSPQSVFSSASGGSTTLSETTTSESGLVIDQKKTTIGILELGRNDTTNRDGSKSRPFVPHVKDALGVGVVGHGISSSLSDSLKIDSLKRIKKQLFIPKAIEKKPKDQ